MVNKIAATLFVALVPALAFADNIGTCGWGSKLMEGNSGIAPQVLAVTTNGTSGNQTFGITTGTSGCTQDGVVHSTWKTAMFVDGNMNKLARDMSVGHGETLNSLADLLGMDDAHKVVFFKASKENFAQIFFSDSVSSKDVVNSLKEVLSRNAELAEYSATM